MGNHHHHHHHHSKNIDDYNMSQHEIELAKATWFKITNVGLHECGVGLMTRILIEHKELKPMWRKRNVLIECADFVNPNEIIRDHGEKVFNTIQTAINSISDLHTVASYLNQMGYEHYKFGVRIEHFHYLGDALMSTLEDALKEEFTDQVRKVWLKIFYIIEIQMKQGMNRAESES